MKIALCIIAFVCIALHALAAMTQIKSNENKTNDVLMIVGALVALVGVVLCLLNNDIDWLLALIGFGIIAYTAVQNGREKQNVHMCKLKNKVAKLLVFND